MVAMSRNHLMKCICWSLGYTLLAGDAGRITCPTTIRSFKYPGATDFLARRRHVWSDERRVKCDQMLQTCVDMLRQVDKQRCLVELVLPTCQHLPGVFCDYIVSLRHVLVVSHSTMITVHNSAKKQTGHLAPLLCFLRKHQKAEATQQSLGARTQPIDHPLRFLGPRTECLRFLEAPPGQTQCAKLFRAVKQHWMVVSNHLKSITGVKCLLSSQLKDGKHMLQLQNHQPLC